MKRTALLLAILSCGLWVFSPPMSAQRRGRGADVAANTTPDLSPLKDVRWRQIGPFRGGRVLAVAGV
ncbi:MAG TPA: hypothetical protein VKS01_09490, partial [Bryobacteraceae bacterium]|nr:hypothetical protein [Bryobacteraceae bacterium]